jgi:hypothetical protein
MGELVYRVKMPLAVIHLRRASPRLAKKNAYGICNTEASEKARQGRALSERPAMQAPPLTRRDRRAMDSFEREVPVLSTVEPRDAQPLLVAALKI